MIYFYARNKEIENYMRIGFLGSKGTFSFEAVSNIYINNEELIECRIIKECV